MASSRKGGQTIVKQSSNGCRGEGQGRGISSLQAANSPQPRDCKFPATFGRNSPICPMPQLGFSARDNDATRSGAFRRRIGHTSKEGSASFAKLAPL